MTFTSDELILALISLVRASNPALLRQEADGFTVDFDILSAKKNLSDDDRLLLKMRGALEADPQRATQDGALVLALEAAESSRLAATLAGLETLQAWPSDVLEMSRALRVRLAANV